MERNSRPSSSKLKLAEVGGQFVQARFTQAFFGELEEHTRACRHIIPQHTHPQVCIHYSFIGLARRQSLIHFHPQKYAKGKVEAIHGLWTLYTTTRGNTIERDRWSTQQMNQAHTYKREKNRERKKAHGTGVNCEISYVHQKKGLQTARC